jgi:hypothetical protein
MKTLTLSLRLGATADIPIRVESDELTFAPITAMTKAAPVASPRPVTASRMAGARRYSTLAA